MRKTLFKDILRAAQALTLVLMTCAPTTQVTSAPTATRQSAVQATVELSTPSPSTAATPIASAFKPTPTRASAEAQPRYGGQVTARMIDLKPMWDPQREKTGAVDLRKQHNLVFSMPVVQPSTPDVPTCKAVLRPDAAEGWRWTNDNTLEVTLRRGIRFHDKPPVNGRELVSDDLAFSLKRALFEEPIQGVDVLAPHVAGIKAVDRYTVQISTDGPLPILVQSLLGNDKGSVIFAKESAGPDGTWSIPERSYIGSGPFIFKQWLPGVKTAYERNPNYWNKGLPYLDRVEFLQITDESTALAALVSGKLDIWSEEMNSNLARAVQSIAPHIQQQRCPVWAGYGPLVPQLQEPPFNDVQVRRALSMAIDRQSLVNTVYRKEGVEAPYGPVGLDEWYLATKDYPPELRKYVQYNPAEARRLLAEAGYRDGLKGIELAASTRWRGDYLGIVEFLLASLPEAGIGVKVNWTDHNVFLAKRNSGQWHGLQLRRGPFNDPWRFMTWPYSQNPPDLNWNMVKDPVLDSLIEQFLRTTDPARGKQLAAQLQFRVADQAWMVPLPQPMDNSALQPWIKNFNRAGYAAYTSTWLEVLWVSR